MIYHKQPVADLRAQRHQRPRDRPAHQGDGDAGNERRTEAIHLQAQAEQAEATEIRMLEKESR